MSWVWNTSRDGADITVRIGAIKIANIRLLTFGKSPKVYVRFHDGEPEGGEYDSPSAAMKHIHELLNSPPIEKA